MKLNSIPLYLVLLAAPWSTLAHAPGLSTATVRIQHESIQAELVFARADLEGLVPMDKEGDGRVGGLELASVKPALEKLGLEALELRAADGPVRAKTSTVRFDETNNVHVTCVFAMPAPGPASMHSALLERLPRGHRQFATVLDGSGAVLAETLLASAQDGIDLPLEPRPGAGVASGMGRHTFMEFLKLGVEHIATGYDHLLFLFALLVMAPGFRQAAAIVTSFTVAHSITLGLATAGVVALPSQIAEPLIAASIVYVGVENILRPKGAPGRWRLTFLFGLIHGFGFAGVLREMGVGAGAGGVALPLLSFNLGVEAGQLAITALVLAALWWVRRFPPVLRWAAPAGSVAVAALGGWWLVERTLL